MTAVYERFGIRFDYPETWSVSEDSQPAWPRSVSVHSPTGAFWSVTLHSALADPSQLVREVLQVLENDYSDAEISETDLNANDRDCAGYEVHFYYLDYLVRAKVLGLRRGPFSVVLLFQAEDRDFDRLSDVFRAITGSFLKSLTAEE